MRSSLAPEDLASWSSTALSREVGEPELVIVSPTSRAVVLGAFQRAEEAGAHDLPIFRRGSGGGAVVVDEGVLYVGLLLPHPGAIAPANETQILNRAVRPLLRALTRSGALTHYFGRDFLTSGKRPIGSVAFGHDAGTRRTLVEAFVSVHTLAQGPRRSFEGKLPATLSDVTGREIAVDTVASRVAEAYGIVPSHPVPKGPPPAVETTPWTARVEEAIGPIFAGRDARGALRVGGELMASRDRIAWLEARADAAHDDEVAAIVDEALSPPGVALFGVRRLPSIAEAIVHAKHAR